MVRSTGKQVFCLSLGIVPSCPKWGRTFLLHSQFQGTLLQDLLSQIRYPECHHGTPNHNSCPTFLRLFLILLGQVSKSLFQVLRT